MLKTLTIGSCVSVQGRLVCSLTDGRIVVAVGDKKFTGYPAGQGRGTPRLSAAK